MDDGKVDVDPNLTSSNNDVLLATKNDKTDANDSTPTSSTDAASSFSGASLNVSEDPISSTSSDVMEKDKLLPETKSENTEKDTEVPKNLLGADGDVDLLEMNIANVSSEPINEDVEDIVQDLENLLGEPEPQHDFPTRRKDKSPSKEKDLIASLDATLEEKNESNTIPELSDAQTSEKTDTDASSTPESNQIAATEKSPEPVVCSLTENESLRDNQITANTQPEEQKNESLEEPKIEKTEDANGESEESNVDQLDNGAIQTEIPSLAVNDNSKVNTVTSSEVKVDKNDKQEETLLPTESTPVVETVDDAEDKDIPVVQTVEDAEDKDTPVETNDQEVEIVQSNPIISCEDGKLSINEVLQSKEDNDNSVASGEISDIDPQVEASKGVIEPERQPENQELPAEEQCENQTSVTEEPSDNQVSAPEEQVENQISATEETLPLTESENPISATEEQCSMKQPVDEIQSTEEEESPVSDATHHTEEIVTQEVSEESIDSPITSEKDNQELIQSSVHKDSENTSSSIVVTEQPGLEVVTTATEELEDSNAASIQEVTDEIADDGSNVENRESAVEISGNVTSSSDQMDYQEQDVDESTIPEVNNVQSQDQKESEEPTLTVAEEPALQEQNIEQRVSSDKIDCEEIEEKLEVPTSELKSEEQVLELETISSTPDTDIGISEETSTEESKNLEETISKVEELPEETISNVEESLEEIIPKAEESVLKIEEIPEEDFSEVAEIPEESNSIVEEISEQSISGPEEIVEEPMSIVEEPMSLVEEIQEETIFEEDSPKSKDKLDNITETIEEESELPEEDNIQETVVLENPVEESLKNEIESSTTEIREQHPAPASDEKVSVEDITEQEESTSNKEPIELSKKEDQSEIVLEEKSSSIVEENVIEEVIERDDVLIENSVTVEEPSTKEDIEEIVDHNSESCSDENSKAVEKCSKEESLKQDSSIFENNVEKMNLQQIEDTTTTQTEECLETEQEPMREQTSTVVGEEETQGIPEKSSEQKETIEENITPVDSKEHKIEDIGQSIEAVAETTEIQNKEEIIEKVEENVQDISQEENQIEEDMIENMEENVCSVEALPENEESGSKEDISKKISSEENNKTEEVMETVGQEEKEEMFCPDVTVTAANIEEPKEEIAMEKTVDENKLEVPHTAGSENKEDLELSEESKKEVKSVDITEESCSITNQESELEGNIIASMEGTKTDEVVNIEKSTEDHELVPVNEELCIKKVIIYEHKCESHNITSNEEKLNMNDAETVVNVTDSVEDIQAVRNEKEIDGMSEGVEASNDDSSVILKDECMVHSSIVDKNEGIIGSSQTAKLEESLQDQVEIENEQTLENNEPLVEKPIVLEEEEREVSSSDQPDCQIQPVTSNASEDLKVIAKSSLETFKKTELSEESIKEEKITEQIIEDQTTAAVQSILNNMLSEDKSIEKVVQKEEPPIVHSSYSSYEVQKAVQELQGITVEPVIIATEDIECISSSDKLSDPEKIEFGGEKITDTNVVSQGEIVTKKESEGLEISKLEDVHAVETTASRSIQEIFEESLNTAQENANSPSNDPEIQDVITQSSYKPSQEDNEVVHEDPSSASEEKSSSSSHINDPVVVPSIDLSEESSTEEDSDEDKKRNVVSSSNISTSVIKESHSDTEDKESKTVPAKQVLKGEKASSNCPLKVESKKHSPRETRHSSRISERAKPHNLKDDINQPLSVNIDDVEKEKPYSPKITIKPIIKEDEHNEDKEEHKGSLKITITKQSDNTHSILKMCSPDVDHRQRQSENEDQNVVPKLVIKTSDTHSDQHSPKMSTRSSKQVLPNSTIRSGSPRITIKPIIKPDGKETITSPLKITIKPIGKPEEFSRQQQRHSPKQVKNKSDDDHYSTRSKMTKTSENSDVHSPKVTIKPVKPPEDAEAVSTPKITIKPIEKPEEARVSPKITIKPVVRPVELDAEVEDEVKERIVLKINKGNLPAKDTERIGRESRKRELEDDKSEKLAKIKLKFSKDGDAHIVHKNDAEVQSSNKRQQDFETERLKRFRAEVATDSDDDVKLIETTQSPIVISEDSQSQDSVILIEEARDPLAEVATPEPKPQVTPVSAPRKRGRPRKVPLVVREEFTNDQKDPQADVAPLTPMSSSNPSSETESSGRPKRSCRAQSARDTLGIKPRKPYKPRGGKRGAGAKSISMKPEKGPVFSEDKINAIKKSLLTEEALQEARSSGILKISENSPKTSENKKEEPIKPLGLKSLLEAAKDQNIIEVIEIDTPSNSPKCLETVEIDKIEEEIVIEEKQEEKNDDSEKGLICTSDIKVFEIQKGVLDLRDDADCIKESSDFGGTDAAASDVEMQPPTPVFAPPLSEASVVDISSTTDIAMFEEETRMSADVSSRAQTPAKQVVSADVVVEESQSSMQSTATTESGKISRRSRLEVHQDQDGSVFTADQLNEYYWGGNGPFMIQEQVAQFLGIKSFKRKYPGIPRRMVDMQERDYIRENGLASESMCDLGLTAVNSADILDIMYTDFQEKYEEFCRFQREKQAKDLLNKQKALSTATNQEKSKLDVLEQAVQSAAAYNANFNKTRREQRRACMDLQTMNIHYPKGKLKKMSMPKIGNYPVAVVPGQFTDYYKEFTPTELNNLPLNTMLYTELHKILPEVSDSDSDSSGSDSDDSSSSGSESNSSCEDNCKMCDKGVLTPRKSPVNSSV